MDDVEARALLGRAREEAVQQLRDLGASFDDIVEASRDSNADDEHDVEGVTIAATRSQVSSLILAVRRRLEELAAAEQRVDDGTYGRCVRCGTDIPDARLRARPATPFCVTCAA